MYMAIAAIILGQGLLLAGGRVIVYAALFRLACHLFVVTYEEPTRQQKFGAEYESYRANVPRWVPRRTPCARNEQRVQCRDSKRPLSRG
jgi:protein-S-isoprenylcysteine O-methyltransferase Ste14